MRPSGLAPLLIVACVALSWPVEARAAPLQLSFSGSPQDLDTDAVAPLLSRDERSGRVLAVWSVRVGTRDLTTTIARVLDARGRPIGAAFKLRGLTVFGGGNRPATLMAIAARPRAGGWIVAAAARSAGTRSRVVSAVVTPGGNVGRRRALSAATAPRTEIRSLGLAVDPRSGRAIVSWFVNRHSKADRATRGSRRAVLARGIDSNGRPRTPVRALYTAPRDSTLIEGEVAIGFVPKTRSWLAVWTHDVRFARKRVINIYARRVLGSVRPRGPVRAAGRAASGDEMFGAPSVIAGTAASGALALFRHETLDGNRLLLARLNANGVVRGRARTVGARGDGEPTSPSAVVDSSSGGLLVYGQACSAVGHGGCRQFTPIIGQRLSASGAPFGASRVIRRQAAGPGVALARSETGSYLLAWQAAAVSGAAYYSDNAMFTIFPNKAEIFIEELTP